MVEGVFKEKTIEDQMDSIIITLSGLLSFRRMLDEAIENLMGATLALNSEGKEDEKIAGTRICVHRAKQLVLEASELVAECIEGNI